MIQGRKAALALIAMLTVAAQARGAKETKLQPQSFADYNKFISAEAPVDKTELARWQLLPAGELQAKLKQNAKASDRAPANIDFVSAEEKAALTKRVEAINKISSPAELDRALALLDTDYDKLSRHEKFLAIMFVPLHEMRGFLWKMRPFFAGSKALHSMSLSIVQRMFTYQKAVMNSNDWDQLMVYLSTPYEGKDGVFVSQFRNEGELTAQFVRFRTALGKSYDRLAALSELSDAQPLLFDKKVLYGAASFKEDLDRYRFVGETDRQFLLASLQMVMGKLAAFRAYSNLNFHLAITEVGKIYGIDGFFYTEVMGAPTKERADRIAKNAKFADYERLNGDGGEWMKNAGLNAAKALEHFRLFVNGLSRKENKQYIVDTDLFKNSDREIALALDNMDAMLKGPTKITSHVTGHSVTVDLATFFANPPQDLKKLYAQDFEGGQAIMKIKDQKGNETTYRSYTYGRGIKWRGDVYKTYFPSITVDANQLTSDVPKATEVLMQSWGGAALGSALVDYL